MSWSEAVGSWRVALRLAGRAVRRSKGRTLLVVLMLMLPVYAGSVLVLSWNGTYASPETVASWRLGRADLQVGASNLDQLEASLPAGSRAAPGGFGRTIVRVGARYTMQKYEIADLGDPIHNGRYVVRDGRAPRGEAEVALSTNLAEALGVRVGSTLSAGVPPRELTVVGLVDQARQLRTAIILAPADHPLSSAGSHHLVVDLPAGLEDWEPPPIDGLGWTSRETLRQAAAAEQVQQAAGLILVVGFAGAQTALLVGAAFAVGARRQRRELAMVGAVGASRSQVARVVLANGVVLGILAGGVGLGLGLVTFWLSQDQVERLADHPLADAGVPVGWLAGIGLFAVAVGLLAALGPARGVARQAIRAGLTDREPGGGARSLWWLTIGLMVAAGGALAVAFASGPSGSIVTVAAGSMGVLFGVAASAPALVTACGRIAARSTPGLRLAMRHASRHRLRTAASVAAVCAAIAGSMAVTLVGAAEDTTHVFRQPNARTGQVLVSPALASKLSTQEVQELERLLPVRATVPVQSTSWGVATYPGSLGDGGTAVPPGAPTPPPDGAGVPLDVPSLVGVGGAELIRVVTGRDPTEGALATLRSGGAVAFYPEAMSDDTVTLLSPDGDPPDITLPAALVSPPDYYTDLPSTIISDETAARLELPLEHAGVILDTTRSPTSAELAAANSIVLAAQATGEPLPGNPTTLEVGQKSSPKGRDYGPMFLVLAIVSAVMTLAASGVSVGLATSEMRNDLATLAAVGASPRLRRWIAAAQAGLIVALGTPLGVIAGIAPAAGMLAFRESLAWQVPWLPLAITVLIAPLLAVAATTVLTRPRLVLVRRLS